MVVSFSGSNLINSITRSLGAYLTYHSGLMSDFGIDQDFIDRRAAEASQRHIQENRLDATSQRHRARSMRSIYSQVTEFPDSPEEIITLDCELIDTAYHIPELIPEGIENEDLQELHCQFDSWKSFVKIYRRLAFHLNNHYDHTMARLREMQNYYLAAALDYYADEISANNIYFTGPEYRVTGTCTDRNRDVRQCLESSELGLLVRLSGQITNISGIRASYYDIAWQCSQCNTIHLTRQNDFDDIMIKPSNCNQSDEIGGCGLNARDANFQLLEAPASRARTIRRALIQEELVQSSDSPVILVEFRESICRQVAPGEVVTVIGYIRSRPADSKSRSDRNREVYMVVTGIERNEQSRDLLVDEERANEIRAWAENRSFDEKISILTHSFCPEIKGRDGVKHGLMLQQTGGSQGTHNLRYDIHIVIFGDPGTGKTVLAKFIEDIHPGTRYESAERATKAGLIAGISSKAEMFTGGDKRVIEPGAMALTPPGAVCIIDEAQFLDEHGQNLSAQLNTALERQEVPITMTLKGKVPTRCPVLLLANPKRGDNSKFITDKEHHTAITEQGGLKESTMTRLDLTYFLLDLGVSADEERQRARSVLNKMNGVNPDFSDDRMLERDFVRDFFAVARTHREVSLSPEASDILIDNQVDMRTSKTKVPVNTRRIASLARLAQAAAKLDFSDTVNQEHANFAISVMACTLQDTDPNQSDGSISPEAVKKKTTIFNGIVSHHKNTKERGYTYIQLCAGIDTFWNKELYGDSPSQTQCEEYINIFVKDGKESHEFGKFRKVGEGKFGFER